jgi:hypothetical protein
MLIFMVVVGCDSTSDRQEAMEPMAVTQCFQAFGAPFGRKDEFYRDEERQCYGQRLLMPRGYYSRKYVSYNPLTETVVIEVGWPSLKPGALLTDDERDKHQYKELKIRAMRFGDFDALVQHTFRVMKTLGIARTDRIFQGMTVYEERDNEPRTLNLTYLFPVDKQGLFLMCLARPRGTDGRSSSPGGCRVVSNIDDRVRIEYLILNSELSELHNVNEALVKLVRGFMVP